ncbi:MAG: hypothetical protein PUC42_14045 [Bacteroidales bacterium]|jgi:hypothetical protein|nr:hypothetical protein [Bacteroidales bacterium]
MVVFVLIIVGLLIYSFAKDTYSETNKIVKEGGIYKKYKILIDNFIEEESGMRIIKESNTYMCVGMKNHTGSVTFHFQHTYNQINVTFEMKNIFIGDHKLEWDFPETMPQTDMIKHIETRTRQYMDNVCSRFS